VENEGMKNEGMKESKERNGRGRDMEKVGPEKGDRRRKE
jgi:hypothetical protein